MSNRARRALLGFSTDLGGLIALTAISLIAAPTILKLTSQTLYGFWVTTISILGYLALTDLGLGMSLTRAVAGLASSGRTKDLNSIISTAFFAFCGVGLLFFVIGISISPYIPTWFKIPREESVLVLSAYRVAIISGAIALPLSVFSGVLVGYQQMAIVNITKNIASITSIGLSIILLLLDVGLVALPIATLFTVVFSSIASFFYARKYFTGLKICISAFNLGHLKSLLSFGGLFQVGRIANTVALSTDNIVIAGSLGAGSVTPYAFTSKLPIMLSVSIASKLPIAVFPAMTEMFAKNQSEKLRQVYRRLTYTNVRFAIFVSAIILVVNPIFVELWVGQQNYGGDTLNYVFVGLALIDTIYRGTTAVVYASGDLKKWTIASIAEASFNIIISIILVGPFGLVGVALGTLISKILTTGFYIPYLICRKLELPINQFIAKSIVSPIFRSIPSVAITYIISSYIPLKIGWLWLMFVVATLVITNILMFEGLALSKPSNKTVKERLFNLILMREEY